MLPSSHSQEELLIANEKKKWDREGKFYQQKKEEKNPQLFSLSSHILRIPLMQVFLQPLLQKFLSLLAKGYAVY